MVQAIPNAFHPDAQHVNEGKVPAHQPYGILGRGPVGVELSPAWPTGQDFAAVPAPVNQKDPGSPVLNGGPCTCMKKDGTPCRGRAMANGRCPFHQ